MSIWNNLYESYKNKNCEEFKKYWSQLTEDDKKSTYFSYYSSLKSKLCPQENKKGKIMMKWKVIKCPSCGSPLTLSEYNKEQIKKLKNGEKQVEFICNYCWNKFIFSDKPFKSLFSDYAIWKEIEIEWKKVKISWAVKYKWKYIENDGWWKLTYIEWLAYDENGEIYYLSESLAEDYEWVYKSTEITKKVNFPFLIKYISRYSVETDKWSYLVKEYDEVKVIQVYWNVNKGYKIWENIKLYNFWGYTLEIEKTENGVERNLYKKVSKWFIEDNLWWDSDIWNIFKYSLLFFIIFSLTSWFKLKCIFIFWLIWNIFLFSSKDNRNINSFIWIAFVLGYISLVMCNSWFGGSWWYSWGSSWGSSSYGGGK